MDAPGLPSLTWVVLTLGDRPVELDRAIASLRADDPEVAVVVVSNGAGPLALDPPGVRVVELPDNRGVPGGRHAGVRAASTDLVAFLDDDAIAPPGATGRIATAFAGDERLGAVSLRLVDEGGRTGRRHVPRPRGTGADRSGGVALFLGGASAVRTRAYEGVGGYFTPLFYGHEELELCWRLVDAGWRIVYLADVEVFHPRTEIGRHARGWELTGRNRVLVARRTLPWPVAAAHVLVWLVVGTWRAPAGGCRASYVRGWLAGWRGPIDRRPIRWRTVLTLTRLGRPPIV